MLTQLKFYLHNLKKSFFWDHFIFISDLKKKCKMITKDLDNNYINKSKGSKLITDNIYKSLLENCFAVLGGKPEVHCTSNLYGSKGDVVKEFYAFLMYISAEFVRNNADKEEIEQILNNPCGLSPSRIKLYNEHFEKHKQEIEASLINIGHYLPHIVDVRWKIDYIVKSSMVNEAEGPIFRVCLVAEEYDIDKESKKLKNIEFTCSAQEFQDLVYKLKDAVRHCHSITNRMH